MSSDLVLFLGTSVLLPQLFLRILFYRPYRKTSWGAVSLPGENIKLPLLAKGRFSRSERSQHLTLAIETDDK